MRSSEEAVAYAKELHKIVTWIGICDGNMQEGSFRCDANVSVRKPGGPLGTRREIKNLNSFKFMQQAIDYEVRWQIDQIEDGHAIQQATVLFDPDTGETRAMRTKEDAADYRYFPDPDLPPLVISREWVEKVKAQLPELPEARVQRFMGDEEYKKTLRNDIEAAYNQVVYGLSEYDARSLVSNRAMADYFEATAKACGQPKLASNWIMGEVSRRLNASNLSIEQSPVSCAQLACLISRVVDDTINNNSAKQVFDTLWSQTAPKPKSLFDENSILQAEGVLTDSVILGLFNFNDTLDIDQENLAKARASVDAIIEAKGLKQMNDTGELEKIIDDVLAANPKNVEEFKAGNTKALNGLVGPIMKASKGKANPGQVNALLMKKLG
jgi:aspartyl-tRNA(Asn)/glutamyl-tRNA(Gln) amidotransferase subunit B